MCHLTPLLILISYCTLLALSLLKKPLKDFFLGFFVLVILSTGCSSCEQKGPSSHSKPSTWQRKLKPSCITSAITAFCGYSLMCQLPLMISTSSPTLKYLCSIFSLFTVFLNVAPVFLLTIKLYTIQGKLAHSILLGY